ncbi:hypothetical protein DEM26_18305 [Thioclava sp. NG1]|uniref:hypothetical protein n=1 Tax=Thioclava sp. NG1 TaxID=2182426 RepID=UPI000D61BEDE|nr:hypothetical protein [Thioclava sp. NG1]PWE48500.1 hypothetical protein DEM26_18305 [Thioclava sp. NG1]
MGLNWKAVSNMQPDHYRADTRHGTYFIGPRKSDGAWEYCTPDEDWGEHQSHILDDLTREKAFAAVEADFVSRESK